MDYKHIAKQVGIGIGVALLVGCVVYTGYTLWNGQRAQDVQAGYNQALMDLVNASESQREINITAGEKTVKFVVVTPAQTPQSPRNESSP